MFIQTHYRSRPKMTTKQKEKLYWLVEEGYITEKEFNRISYSTADYFAHSITFDRIANRIKEKRNQDG